MAQKKLKQDDLIAVFGVTTRGAVGHYMTGRRTPTPEQLKAVANKFEISLDRLMDNIPANSERLTVLYGQIEKLTDVQRSAVEQMVDVLMKSNTENKIENTSPSPENKPLTNKAPNAGGGGAEPHDQPEQEQQWQAGDRRNIAPDRRMARG